MLLTQHGKQLSVPGEPQMLLYKHIRPRPGGMRGGRWEATTMLPTYYFASKSTDVTYFELGHVSGLEAK